MTNGEVYKIAEKYLKNIDEGTHFTALVIHMDMLGGSYIASAVSKSNNNLWHQTKLTPLERDRLYSELAHVAELPHLGVQAVDIRLEGGSLGQPVAQVSLRLLRRPKKEESAWTETIANQT